MGVVSDALLKHRAGSQELQNIAGAFGPKPSRPPPSDTSVAELRAQVCIALDLDPAEGELHNAFSPWRHAVVARLQELSGDPDKVLSTWLRVGAPMGIDVPIDPGGLFPLFSSPASLPSSAVVARAPVPNHASFRDCQSCARPPGHDVIEAHLNQGFGLLFESKEAAEHHLGTRVMPAPLGTVSKRKEDGSMKHRVILDLRANCVNLASSTPERQVLPSLHDHARDLAELGRHWWDDQDQELWTLILDIQDAFMGIPLASPEQPYNCCASDLAVVRSRAAAYDGEPARGHFILWAVLGFGGKPNPLVFARAVSFASRYAQALLRPDPLGPGCRDVAVGRLQCYVDDPCASFLGPPGTASAAVDLIICFWLVLGLPLAWK